MSGVNKAIIVGRLGKDPDVRHLEGGKVVASFSVATSEKYKDNETTTWHNIILWGKLAEVAEKYLNKGDQVYLEGKITNRSYESNGTTKYVTEIVGNNLNMLGSPKNEDKPNEKSEDLDWLTS